MSKSFLKRKHLLIASAAVGLFVAPVAIHGLDSGVARAQGTTTEHGPGLGGGTGAGQGLGPGAGQGQGRPDTAGGMYRPDTSTTDTDRGGPYQPDTTGSGRTAEHGPGLGGGEGAGQGAGPGAGQGAGRPDTVP